VTAVLQLPRTYELAALRGVSVRIGDSWLLRDIDWNIRAGERWAVIGANGAGKTTLLQVLAGVRRPSEGSVELLDEPLDEADLDEVLPRVGWGSASLAEAIPRGELVLNVVLTASYAATVRGDERYDAYDITRARGLLTQVGCRTLVERPFGTLSEGERKRVLLARSIMTDPELLLLDEPAAGLDLGGREALLRMLGRLARDPQAPATVLVSHHVEEIPVGFTHVLVLRQGAVVAGGPIERTLTAAVLTAAFGLPLRVSRAEGRWSARALV